MPSMNSIADKLQSTVRKARNVIYKINITLQSLFSINQILQLSIS